MRNWGYSILKLRNQVPNSWKWLENNAKSGNVNYLQTFMIRIRRRVTYLVNVSKGKYITPNETVEVLSKALFIPESVARRVVKICFFAFLDLRNIFVIKVIGSRKKA